MSPYRRLNLTVMAVLTDLAYLVIALWDSDMLRGAVRHWARRRYRKSGSSYDRYVGKIPDYAAPLQMALQPPVDRPHRILDVSTGTGSAALLAMTRFPGARLVGCDLSPSMLSQARRRLPGAALVCCDSAYLPFAGGAFDLVLLQNAPPSLKELARVTKPAGWLAIGFSTASRLPTWLPRWIVRRLRRFGFDEVRWDRAGRGVYVLARRAAIEDAA